MSISQMWTAKIQVTLGPTQELRSFLGRSPQGQAPNEQTKAPSPAVVVRAADIAKAAKAEADDTEPKTYGLPQVRSLILGAVADRLKAVKRVYTFTDRLLDVN